MRLTANQSKLCHSSLEHTIYGKSCFLLAFLNLTTCHLSNLRSTNLLWSLSPLSSKILFSKLSSFSFRETEALVPGLTLRVFHVIASYYIFCIIVYSHSENCIRSYWLKPSGDTEPHGILFIRMMSCGKLSRSLSED